MCSALTIAGSYFFDHNTTLSATLPDGWSVRNI